MLASGTYRSIKCSTTNSKFCYEIIRPYYVNPETQILKEKTKINLCRFKFFLSNIHEKSLV
jgi:hypothetical protein